MNRKLVNGEEKRAKNREAQRKHRAKQAAEKKSREVRIDRLEGFIQDTIEIVAPILEQNNIPTLENLLNDAKRIARKNDGETVECNFSLVKLDDGSNLPQNCFSSPQALTLAMDINSVAEKESEQPICQIDQNWGWLGHMDNASIMDATQAFCYPNYSPPSQLGSNETTFNQFITPYEFPYLCAPNITW